MVIGKFNIDIRKSLGLDRMKFEVKKARNKQFYFVLKARNGEIILTSEYYLDKQGCLNGIKSVRFNGIFAPVIEI